MSGPNVRYETAPTLFRPDPQCDSCAVIVESTGDCFECPQCGTTWEYDTDEDSLGTLYAEWSGESVDDLPLLQHDTAYLWRETSPPPPPSGDFECCASGRCEVCTPGYVWGRDG